MEYLEWFWNGFVWFLRFLFTGLTQLWLLSVDFMGEPIAVLAWGVGGIAVFALVFFFGVAKTQGGVEHLSASTMKFLMFALLVFAVFFFLYLIDVFG